MMDKTGYSFVISTTLIVIKNNTDKELIISKMPEKPKRSLEDLEKIEPFGFKTFNRTLVDLTEICCRLSKKRTK